MPDLSAAITGSAATSLTDASWAAGNDPYLTQPFVDIDEQRSFPVPHRYVHGGFEGTATKFSFYFPPVDLYRGRFFQHVTPVPLNENLAQTAVGEEDRIGFSAASGAYFVETNGGGPKVADRLSGMDPSIGAYRVSAEAARFSRLVAAEIYGNHRPYGYLYGGSGGSYRTIGASENTTDVWDGYVPYVVATPMSIPSNFSVRMNAQRVLRNKFDDIADAFDVGGDPASLVLTEHERRAFEEVTRFGFPPRSWFGWRTMGMHGFSALYPGVMAADPTFADDFWTVPGYEGADPAASVHQDRVQLRTHVAKIIYADAAPLRPQAGGVDVAFLGTARNPVTAIRLADIPDGWALGALLTVTSGAAAGSVLRLSAVESDVAHLEPGQDGDVLQKLQPGDQLLLDNSSFLAAQTYHRHQVPGPEYAAWDHLRDADGNPTAPQRPALLGPLFAAGTAGSVPTGAISGKMIAVVTLLDREAFPWHGDWFKRAVRAQLGDQAHKHFRLWYIDNATHGDSEDQEFPTRTVSYLGALQAALREVAAWAEEGKAPHDDSAYELVDGQIIIPKTASERGGVQPVATLLVNGRESVTVDAGATVEVSLHADAAPGTILVNAHADLTGSGELDSALPVDPAEHLDWTTTVSFTRPGTYFLAARITAQAQADPADTHAHVPNIARARVVVSEEAESDPEEHRSRR